MGKYSRNPRNKKHGKKHQAPRNLPSTIYTYSYSSPPPSSQQSLVDKEIYYCLDILENIPENSIYRHIKFNFWWLSSSDGGKSLLPIIAKMPEDMPRCPRTAVTMGSKIYVHCRHRFLYFDTHRPEDGWVSAPPSQPRFLNVAHVYGGKIYVFGRPGDSPFAEVFDPYLNCWETFDNPPLEIVGCGSLAPIHHNIGESSSRFFVHASFSGFLCEFDFVTKSWTLLNTRFAPPNEYYPLCMVGDIIYRYEDYKIYGYDLITNLWFPNPVEGYSMKMDMEELSPSPIYLLPFTTPLLMHIGNGELLMTWSFTQSKNTVKIMTDVFIVDVVDYKAREDGGGLASSSSASLVGKIKSQTVSEMLCTNGSTTVVHCLVL